nr:twin-arginine translocase subunit TatC [Arthrobacter sp. SO3]
MALLEHLKELRNRLFKAAIAAVLGTVAGFFVYQPVLAALVKPIRDLNEQQGRRATLNFDGVASSFDLMIQVSVFLGLILASPVWLYQLWAFIVPGLHKKERRMALSFVAAAVPLFVGGVLLAWLVLPNAVRVLTEFTPSGGSNFISAQVYLTFVLRLLAAFGIAFLLPVVLVGLNLAGSSKAGRSSEAGASPSSLCACSQPWRPQGPTPPACSTSRCPCLHRHRLGGRPGHRHHRPQLRDRAGPLGAVGPRRERVRRQLQLRHRLGHRLQERQGRANHQREPAAGRTSGQFPELIDHA